MVAPSSLIVPCLAGQIPTSAFDSDVLPDALEPSSARPVPALSEKETLDTIGVCVPGATTARSCTASSRRGRGSATGGAGGLAVALHMSRRRKIPCRAATSRFQVTHATLTG